MTDNVIQLSKYRSTSSTAARDGQIAQAAPSQAPLPMPTIDRALNLRYPGGIDDLPT